jgi:SEC-C motif domain protein
MPETMTDTEACPCGSALSYLECCGPLHDGGSRAQTAEALMRARYSAFARGNIDFLHDSLATRLRGDFDRSAAAMWAKSEWLGLEILDQVDGHIGAETGEVEFIARFRLQGSEQQHHERARFSREGGEWRYDDGDLIGETRQPVVSGPKTGRNEVCPCGSGRKFKKCCGSRAVAS